MDLHVFTAFAPAHENPLLYEVSKASHLGDPRPYLIFAVGIVVLALITRGPRVATLVGGVIVLSNLTAVLLAHTVSVGRVPFPDPTSWPSNHTTAVASAGLSLLLIARGRLLAPTAVVAFGMTAGLPLMLLIRETHLLSDLVAAQLVAGFWALLAAQSGRRLKIGRGSSLMTSMTQRRKPGT